MKTANETYANYSVENPSTNFQFRLAPNTDSASLKAWEEENEEYASWELINIDKEPATC